MRYLGGKAKLSKRLIEVIEAHTDHRDVVYEPFMGGGGMTPVLAKSFNHVQSYDNHQDLVLMWQALLNGWEPPETLTKQEYEELRTAPPSALRGFAGFGVSFGGMWFSSFARDKEGKDYAAQSRRTLMRDIKHMKNVTVQQADYRELTPFLGDVVYADPPYAGTAQYHCPFDSEEFWRTMERWVELGADVFVSEFNAPAHWETIMEIPRKVMVGARREVVDRLFTLR